MADLIEVALADGIQIITINRPDARNAINLETAQAMAAALDELDNNPAARIGILTGARYTFPYTVDFQLANVGGPSAGMMLALGIYDKLTPGALTGGAHIAGTGTITADGQVGAIGGIRQKMYGARNAGADWFLAPASNCDEVVGHVPDGLRVFAVSTLDEALTDVKAIAAHDTADLATCVAK